MWPGASVKWENPCPNGSRWQPRLSRSAGHCQSSDSLWLSLPQPYRQVQAQAHGSPGSHPLCATPGLGRRCELCRLWAAESLRRSQRMPRRLQEASRLLEDSVCALTFQETPECCQAWKGRVLACCEAAVLSETRGARKQLVLDVSLLDSPLPLHLLSLSIYYPLPVNPQNALNQMTSWRTQLHGIKIL